MPIKRPLRDPNRIVTAPSHTKRVFDPATQPAVVRWARKLTKELQADAIVACGHSGLIVAAIVGHSLRIPVFAVRKRSEVPVAGSSKRVSGVAPHGKAQRWVWIDDFMASGGTFRRSVEDCWKEGLLATPVPAAILHYGDYRSKSQSFIDVNDAWGGSLCTVIDHPALPGDNTPVRVPSFGFMK